MDEKEKLEKIKNDLTLEQIESLLSFLGGEPIRQNNIITSKTICHCGQSHKLFYYDNLASRAVYTYENIPPQCISIKHKINVNDL